MKHRVNGNGLQLEELETKSNGNGKTVMDYKNDDDFWPEGTLPHYFISGTDWLKRKREYDGHGKLWRVHDNLYDLTSYVDSHPGGSEWLSFTQGTDITEIFMSSHIINTDVVETVLKKYLVKPADTPRKQRYTFNENDFYMTLKRRAEPILKKSGTGPTFAVRMVQNFLASAFILTAILGTMWTSYSMLTLSGALLYCLWTSAHNFLHIKDTWRKYFFDFSLWSYAEFRMTHCISHHVFPNTMLDWETTIVEPFVVFRHVKTKTWFQRFGPVIYIHMMGLVGFYAIYAHKLFKTLIVRDEPFRAENLIPFFEYIAMASVAPTWTDATIAWMIIHSISSYIFVVLGYSTAHHHTTCYQNGDVSRQETDWGMNQMDATRDTPTNNSDSVLFNSVVFGEHTLHHLFPTVCHSKYPLLKPLLDKTMKEFGLNHPRPSRFEQFTSTMKNFGKITPNIF